MFNAKIPKLGQTWVESGTESCGARPDGRGPIGGGPGYSDLFAANEGAVTSLDQLLEALAGAKSGDTIYIHSRAEIDCTERVYIEELVLEVPAGVTLASDRGRDGSPGGLICSDTFATNPLLRAVGPGVRLSGLRLRGPNPRRCLDHHRRSFAEGRGHEYYYKFPTSTGIAAHDDGLRVDNCELGGWSLAAIYLNAGANHHIHHNFIHHNQYQGLGYGVSHTRATSLIEYNLFNYNRHSIAGSGVSGSGYEARHNIEIRASLSHCFDMHGGRDRKDGTDVAGSWLKVHHNTFRCPQAAVVIRGVPEQGAEVHHNWFYQRPEGLSVRSDGGTQVRDNVYGLRQKEFVPWAEARAR